MAGIKSSVRIFGIGLWVAGFAVACSQLLGEIDIDGSPSQGTGSLFDPDAGPEPLPIICEEGQTRCDGPLLQRCISGGTAWLTTNVCPTDALCQATDGTTVSQCLPPTCAVEQMSCEGAQLLLCNKGRNGWVGFDDCTSNAHCDATARACLDAPCEAGQLRCNVGRLERCNELRTDWELVDECETNELCEVTRTRAATGTLEPAPGTGEGQPGAGALPPGAPAPLACAIPECVPGERRCTGDRLEFCNEGRTGWELAETCATPVLCVNSLTYAGTGERPRCVRAACNLGEHECTPGGVLQVCDEGRDRFRQLETCIGPPFCNSVEADQGRSGCLAAPCAAGEMQCNGPQRQVCRQDRTGFDPVGAPCETRDLCNDDNTANAFCRPAVCQRGPTSTTEFRCQGSVLERCNDQHTGYEPFAQCETAGLCNAGFGFQGCRPPVCAEGERRCQGDFVQVCNAQRTAFENEERCDPGTCDSVAGRCATPCVLNSRRCNNQGQVEECRDRLIGREIVARCASPQLCDGATGTCREPPAGCIADGVRRCRQQGQNTVLEECRDGRSRFVTLDTCSPAAGEICDPSDVLCDVCQQGSQPVCEGSSVVACAANGQSRTSTACQFGCVAIAGAPDRCRDCDLGGPGTCSGNVLTTCAEDADLTGQERNNACTSANACQTELSDCNRDGDGRDCSCTPCNEGQTNCSGAQPTVCSDPQRGFLPDGAACRSAEHCDPDRDSGQACFECIRGELRCIDGQIRICNNSTNTFDPPGGRIQCIEGNSVALVCGSGANPTRDVCDDDEFCQPGVGCVVCVPGSARCVDGDRSVCAADGSGFGPPQQCDVTSTCFEPGTCALNGCVAGGPSPLETPCRRGNASGFCENGQCLECVRTPNCNDGIACTDDRCNNVGTCEETAVNSRCVDSEACDGVETCSVAQGCVPGTNLPNNTSCTIVGGGAGFCSDGTCEECITPLDCGPPATECRAAFTCVGNECGGGGVINNNGRCDPPGAATVGVCQSGTCNAVGCITPEDCNGPPASECRAATTCTANVCGGGGAINNNGRCDPSGTATVGVCQNGTCNPVACITPEDCGQSAASECRAATTCVGNTCGGGEAINNGGRCDPPGTATVGLCQGGACNAVQCINAGDCAGPPASDCREPTVCLENRCSGGGVINNQPCDPAGEATVGICRGGMCNAVECVVDRNCDDGLPCTTDACSPQNVCSHTALAAGTACGAGSQCDADGGCVLICGNGAIDPGEACDPRLAQEPCPEGTTGSRVCSADCSRVIDNCVRSSDPPPNDPVTPAAQ